jgi:FAD/FMN-containing dehydrogenase
VKPVADPPNTLGYDEENREWWTTLAQLQKFVARERLFYPPDPSSLEVCTLGGNVAQGASGPRALKYGSTKDYVTYLQVVGPNGECGDAGEIKRVRPVSLLVGSEGRWSFTAIGLGSFRCRAAGSSWHGNLGRVRSSGGRAAGV